MSKRIALLNYEDVNGIAADSKSMQVYSLLDNDPQYEINELDKVVYDYQNNLQVIHNAESDSQALEQTVNILQGNQITQSSALEAISILSNHIAKRNGLSASTQGNISTESIVGSVSSAVKNIIEAIRKAIAKVIEWVSSVFKRLFGASEKLEVQQEELQKEADKAIKGTDAKEFDKANDKPKMVCKFDRHKIEGTISGKKFLSEGHLLELGDPSKLVSDFAGALEDIVSVSFSSEKDFLDDSKLHKSYADLEKIVQNGDGNLPPSLRTATSLDRNSIFEFKQGGKAYSALKVSEGFFSGDHEVEVFGAGLSIVLLAKTKKYVDKSWRTTLERMIERCKKALDKLTSNLSGISSKGEQLIGENKITEADLKKTLSVYRDTIKLAQMQFQTIVTYDTVIVKVVAEYQRMIRSTLNEFTKSKNN